MPLIKYPFRSCSIAGNECSIRFITFITLRYDHFTHTRVLCINSTFSIFTNHTESFLFLNILWAWMIHHVIYIKCYFCCENNTYLHQKYFQSNRPQLDYYMSPEIFFVDNKPNLQNKCKYKGSNKEKYMFSTTINDRGIFKLKGN